MREGVLAFALEHHIFCKASLNMCDEWEKGAGIRVKSLRFFSTQLQLPLHHLFKIASSLMYEISFETRMFGVWATYLDGSEIVSSPHDILCENRDPFDMPLPVWRNS